jgi:hypothetical protein
LIVPKLSPFDVLSEIWSHMFDEWLTMFASLFHTQGPLDVCFWGYCFTSRHCFIASFSMFTSFLHNTTTFLALMFHLFSTRCSHDYPLCCTHDKLPVYFFKKLPWCLKMRCCYILYIVVILYPFNMCTYASLGNFWSNSRL